MVEGIISITVEGFQKPVSDKIVEQQQRVTGSKDKESTKYGENESNYINNQNKCKQVKFTSLIQKG